MVFMNTNIKYKENFFKKLNKNNNAQGTIEYLIIIAIVVVIALVVVGLLTGFFETGSSVSTTQQKIGQQIQNIALTETLVTQDGNYLLEINSNELTPITITKITIDGVDQNFYENNTINLGEQKIFQIPTQITCITGTKKTTQNITITFIQKGIIKTHTYQNILTPCENFVIETNTNLADPTPPQQEVPIPNYTITINTSGEGSITINQIAYTIPQQFQENEQVTLTATPQEGWEFIEWTGSISTAQNPTIITMDENKTITATFQEETENPINIVQLRNGLVGYWPLDNTFEDYSENENHGICGSNCPTYTEDGGVGGAYIFNGSSNYISSTNTSSTITGNSQRTITAWVKLETTSNTHNGDIVNTGSGDCTSKMFGLGSLGYKLHFWSGCNDQSSNLTIPTNEWVFVAIVYNGTEINATVNDDTVTINKNNFGTLSSKLFIGAETTNNGSSFRTYFDGGIDEVAIWNRALSEDEILNLYNNGDGLSLVID